MHDEVTPAVGEDGGDVEDPVAHGLGLGLGQIAPSKHVIWLQASSAPASKDTATQASLAQKPSKGRLASPQAFQVRTRSSTRAWPRWRSSSAAMSAPSVLVMKQVWRHPAWVSKRESWAPGMGALAATDHPHVGRPALDLVELAQLDDLGARSDPPVELTGARTQSSSWANSRASRTEPLMGKPIE